MGIHRIRLKRREVGKEEGNRRMMQAGKLLAITGFAGPVLSVLVWKLSGNEACWELVVLTWPLWTLSFIAGLAIWIAGFIKEGYSQ